MRLYIAGPMRGLPNFNRIAFDSAAADLRALGHEVFNPVEDTIRIYGEEVYQNNPEGDAAHIDRSKVLCNDLTYICLRADAVVLLAGWSNSLGATAEYAVAKALGKPTYKLTSIIQRGTIC